MSQLAFAYKMMEENRSNLNDDRLELKRSGGTGGVKCEDFASLYSLHSSDAAVAAAGAPSLSRSLSDHSGKTFIIPISIRSISPFVLQKMRKQYSTDSNTVHPCFYLSMSQNGVIFLMFFY
jgi:hypothetical protein